MILSAPDACGSFVRAVRRTCVLLGILLWVGSSAGRVRAQVQHDRLQIVPLSPVSQAQSGVQMVKRGRTGDALRLLEEATGARPTLVLSAHGAVEIGRASCRERVYCEV